MTQTYLLVSLVEEVAEDVGMTTLLNQKQLRKLPLGDLVFVWAPEVVQVAGA